jgi:hypothetical protein
LLQQAFFPLYACTATTASGSVPIPTIGAASCCLLTAEGWALYRHLLPHVGKVANNVFRDLTAGEIAQLSRLIDMMTSRLEKPVVESDSRK